MVFYRYHAKLRDLDDGLSPVSLRSSSPLAVSQSLMVLSSLPEASVRPSGENATE
jgi:hypothetical protein